MGRTGFCHLPDTFHTVPVHVKLKQNEYPKAGSLVRISAHHPLFGSLSASFLCTYRQVARNGMIPTADPRLTF